MLIQNLLHLLHDKSLSIYKSAIADEKLSGHKGIRKAYP